MSDGGLRPVRHLLSCLLALLVILTGTPALAVDYPPAPAGPILDEANLLPPDREAALDSRLRELSAKTGRALIVVTVNSLQGESDEMYAVKLFEAWGIGGKETDQGLLFLIAPNERKVRIEVGYGLHGYMTDGLSGRIIRTIVTPRFKAGDMPGGVEAGVDALVQQLSRTPEDAKAVAEAADARKAGNTRQSSGTVVGAILIVFVILLIILSLTRRKLSGGRRYRSHDDGGIAPIVIWAASEILSNSLRGGHRGGGWGDGGGGGWGGGDGGGFGGFGGGGSGGGGASGDW